MVTGGDRLQTRVSMIARGTCLVDQHPSGQRLGRVGNGNETSAVVAVVSRPTPLPAYQPVVLPVFLAAAAVALAPPGGVWQVTSTPSAEISLYSVPGSELQLVVFAWMETADCVAVPGVEMVRQCL